MLLDPTVVAAAILLLLPMAYLLLAAPAFLLVRLDIPPVTMLLRAVFNAYFLVLLGVAAIGAVALMFDGHIVLAAAMAIIAWLSNRARPWFLNQMDVELSARDAGNRAAVGRLRRLHWAAMLCNSVLLSAVIASINYGSAPL